MRSSLVSTFKALSCQAARSGPRAPLSPSIIGSSASLAGPNASFDKNFPSPRSPKKAWDGQNKDKYFRDKFAHIHTGQKRNQEAEYREAKGKKPLSPYKASRSFSRNKSRRSITGEKDVTPKKQKPRFSDVEVDSYNLMLENPNVEYLYGTQAVIAALQNADRNISRLFTQDEAHLANRRIIELAENNDISVVYDVPKSRLNQMAKNGVHNRYVIETRPLLNTDITALSAFDPATQKFSVKEMSSETELSFDLEAPHKKRFPLGLFIDQVTDVHNFGAILRSAYFLGVDFVAYCDKDCAKLSAVVAKTSSGALDYINLFNVARPLPFFTDSQQAGWTVVASTVTKKQPAKAVLASQLHELLETGPCMLVLGSEGDGLRKNIVDLSDFVVTLGGSQDPTKVDSLNVSVASALMLSKFFKDDAFDV